MAAASCELCRCGADSRSAARQVLRIDRAGKTRRIYVKRRDLLRANGLQPRDLRRIDPSLSITKTAPAITVKENVLLINLGGVRCAWPRQRTSVVRLIVCLCRMYAWHGVQRASSYMPPTVHVQCLAWGFEPGAMCLMRCLHL